MEKTLKGVATVDDKSQAHRSSYYGTSRDFHDDARHGVVAARARVVRAKAKAAANSVTGRKPGSVTHLSDWKVPRTTYREKRSLGCPLEHFLDYFEFVVNACSKPLRYVTFVYSKVPN